MGWGREGRRRAGGRKGEVLEFGVIEMMILTFGFFFPRHEGRFSGRHVLCLCP